MKNMNDSIAFLLIECLASIIFLLLIILLVDENSARTIIILYGIVWIPALFISTKIYNSIIDSDKKSES